MGRAPSSSNAAVRRLQDLIAERQLEPGDRLGTETELAEELAVSRPAVVREAVRLLSRANLVRAARGPGGGVFVAQTADRGLARTVSDAIAVMLKNNLTSIPELIEVRLLLEVPLAGLAAERADAATVSQLRRAIDEAERGADDEGTQRETDTRFHRTIAEAGGKPGRVRARRLVTSPAAAEVLPELIEPAIVESVARDQHRQILDAIEQHKPALAEQAMREHLRYIDQLCRIVSRPAS